MSKAVGNPLEIRLRALAEKAALDFPKETKVTITTEAQRNDPDLFYNCYPELFEIDYLRTLPRPKVTFAPGTIGLDLRQFVNHHASNSDKLQLSTHIGFNGCSNFDEEESLLLLFKKSRNSLVSIKFHNSPVRFL